MKQLILLLLLAAVCPSLLAEGKPSTTEAKKVIDFYLNGQGQGVVLTESKVCADVSKEGANKYECVSEKDPASLAAGEAAYLWMSYMVPENTSEQKIVIKFEKDGEAKITKDFTVSGSLRYRAWRMFRLHSAGDWTAKIYHESRESSEMIGSQDFKVM
jgi:hypothetical protein